MSAEKIPSIFKERVVRVTALTTAVIAASSASLLIVREIHQLREIEKKRVLIQQAAKDIDTGEAGVIFVEGKSSFVHTFLPK